MQGETEVHPARYGTNEGTGVGDASDGLLLGQPVLDYGAIHPW
jgi:hypothetical protein